MEDYENIGSISFFVNDPKDGYLSKKDLAEIELQIMSAYQNVIQHNKLGDQLIVTKVESRRGCAVVTLTLAATFWGAITFFKNYEQAKSGAIQFAKDLNGLYIKLKGWKKKHRVWFYRSDEPKKNDKK